MNYQLQSDIYTLLKEAVSASTKTVYQMQVPNLDNLKKSTASIFKLRKQASTSTFSDPDTIQNYELEIQYWSPKNDSVFTSTSVFIDSKMIKSLPLRSTANVKYVQLTDEEGDFDSDLQVYYVSKKYGIQI